MKNKIKNLSITKTASVAANNISAQGNFQINNATIDARLALYGETISNHIGIVTRLQLVN